jgi:hypothetical protein
MHTAGVDGASGRKNSLLNVAQNDLRRCAFAAAQSAGEANPKEPERNRFTTRSSPSTARRFGYSINE